MINAREARRRIVRRCGYRITRRQPGVRGQAMEEALAVMKSMGFHPNVVIDGGANFGQWARSIHPLFPNARWHLIEPQPTCHPELARFAAKHRDMALHRVALTQPGVREVSLTGIGADGGSSGAYISNSEQSLEATGTIRCPAASLDDLFSSTISSADRSLLKLDLEGHELQALKGAIQLLERIEVVVCEVAFFDINDGGRPLFTDISEFLLRHSFVLFDLASLNGRPRDERLRTGDAIYARKNSFLVRDNRFD